jgi:hypothetical protein
VGRAYNFQEAKVKLLAIDAFYQKFREVTKSPMDPVVVLDVRRESLVEVKSQINLNFFGLIFGFFPDKNSGRFREAEEITSRFFEEASCGQVYRRGRH